VSIKATHNSCFNFPILKDPLRQMTSTLYNLSSTISEWKTKEWHFKTRDPKENDFKSIILLTSDWDMEINHGIPYPQDFVHELTGVQYTISWADNIYLFNRPLTNHFLQTFIPSMMLSVVSASSVFIPSEIVPGRMALSITSFLSLISLFNGAR
jgi:hypothetical protein